MSWFSQKTFTARSYTDPHRQRHGRSFSCRVVCPTSLLSKTNSTGAGRFFCTWATFYTATAVSISVPMPWHTSPLRLEWSTRVSLLLSKALGADFWSLFARSLWRFLGPVSPVEGDSHARVPPEVLGVFYTPSSLVASSPGSSSYALWKKVSLHRSTRFSLSCSVLGGTGATERSRFSLRCAVTCVPIVTPSTGDVGLRPGRLVLRSRSTIASSFAGVPPMGGAGFRHARLVLQARSTVGGQGHSLSTKVL